MIEFIGGILVGAFGLTVLALHFSKKAKKSKDEPATPSFNAVGVGNGSVASEDRTRINEILKAIDQTTLYERFTRH